MLIPKGVDPEFVVCLRMAERDSGVAFVVTSGLRSLAKNVAVGGVFNSAHLRGLAVDLLADNSRARFLIVRSLLRFGFTRIGIEDGCVHVDVSKSLPQRVLWR